MLFLNKHKSRTRTTSGERENSSGKNKAKDTWWAYLDAPSSKNIWISQNLHLSLASPPRKEIPLASVPLPPRAPLFLSFTTSHYQLHYSSISQHGFPHPLAWPAITYLPCLWSYSPCRKGSPHSPRVLPAAGDQEAPFQCHKKTKGPPAPEKGVYICTIKNL